MVVSSYTVLFCNRKYKMPSKAGQSCETKGESALAVTNEASLELPVSAVAGLQGTDAEKFEEYVDSCERACPSTHCWTPAGEVLIGCSTGELLKVACHLLAFLGSPGKACFLCSLFSPYVLDENL